MKSSVLRCGLLFLLPPGLACNTQPLTDLALTLMILPRAIAIPGNNQFINPGQVVTLDGSSSGLLLGDGTFLQAGQVDMTFSWTIMNAIDRATDQEIDLAGTGAMLTDPNTSVPTFTAATPADYNIQLTVTAGPFSGSNIVGVRVQ